MTLKGRVALVTGGGRGLGREIALALAREGLAVAVAARRGNPSTRPFRRWHGSTRVAG